MQERKDEDKPEERLFVHDVSVSIISLNPYDLRPGEALGTALEWTRGGSSVQTLRPQLCDSQCGQRLFTNLFWLFFCLKFQPASFCEVGVLFRCQEIGRI